MTVYFDNAATTPIDDLVVEFMLPFLKEMYGNPSATHAKGREVRAAIEKARKEVASYINAQASEIIFTSGSTEANNTVFYNAVNFWGVERIITSQVEHHCVLHSVEYYGKDIEVVILDVHDGIIDCVELEKILEESDKKTLVSIIHGNNESGYMNDIERIGSMCLKNKALFHSDTVQTIGHFDIDVNKLSVDFITGSAHKFHGPKGIGFLFFKKGHKINPLIHGGGQERNKRAGTENVLGIVGMSKALSIAVGNMEEDKKHIISVRNHFIDLLNKQFKDIQFNSPVDSTQGLYTVLNVSFPPHPNASLILFQLDMEGICASGGSACTSGAMGGSHVLNAMGVPSDRVNIRFSFSKYNILEEVDYTMEKLVEVFNNIS